MMEPQPTVRHCYRCGNRVKKGADHCWYCNAPTRRHIRPPRQCPYCRENVARQARKCPHCGEYLDESLRSETKPQQPIMFMIAPGLIGQQGDQPMQIPGGQPVPRQVARALDHQTVRAIEANNPKAISQQGVKALPAPEAPPEPGYDIIEAEASPVVRRKQPGSLAKKQAKKAGFALARAADRFMDAMEKEEEKEIIAVQEGQRVAETQTQEEKPSSRFRQCPQCNTEVLAEDNYCFHCGALLRQEGLHPSERRKMRRALAPSTIPHLFFVLILLVAQVYLVWKREPLEVYPFFREYLPATVAVFSGLAFLTLVYTFFRRRTSLNQVACILLLVAWACISLFALLFMI